MTYPCRLYHCHGIQICTCNRNYQFCLCNLHLHHMVLDYSSIRLHLNETESVHLRFIKFFEKATETKAIATKLYMYHRRFFHSRHIPSCIHKHNLHWYFCKSRSGCNLTLRLHTHQYL